MQVYIPMDFSLYRVHFSSLYVPAFDGPLNGMALFKECKLNWPQSESWRVTRCSCWYSKRGVACVCTKEYSAAVAAHESGCRRPTERKSKGGAHKEGTSTTTHGMS